MAITDAQRRRQVLQRYEIPDGPYLLTLCTLEPRKNLARTIEAFEQIVNKHPDPRAARGVVPAVGLLPVPSRAVLLSAILLSFSSHEILLSNVLV